MTMDQLVFVVSYLVGSLLGGLAFLYVIGRIEHEKKMRRWQQIKPLINTMGQEPPKDTQP